MTEVSNILKRLPVGIQTFEKIIEGGYLYVDKTGLMYDMVHLSKYIFLSRPRRFGKSLLTSTLEAYFQGRKELFSGLAAEQKEKEWTIYPVIKLDMSRAASSAQETLTGNLMFLLSELEKSFGIPQFNDAPSLGARFQRLISDVREKNGRDVVVIVDEYDAPLLDVLGTEAESRVRTVLKEFYSPLKSMEDRLEFVFITGITKFSQLSIFSTLNNLTNISLLPQYSALCGFTEEELFTLLGDHIKAFAADNDITEEEGRRLLKQRYDGYHFSGKSPDIYNPFSILNVLATGMLQDYWFSSGTPTFLIGQMQRFGTDILSLDGGVQAPATAFDQPTEAMDSALPLLYQSGYLTIRSYDRASDTYTLGIPNAEVRKGLLSNLLPLVTGRTSNESIIVQSRFISMWYKGQYDEALTEIKSFLAGIPYPEFGGMLRKESYYETLMYVLFASAADTVAIHTQVKIARGRVDMVLTLPDTVTAFEFKVDGTAEKAIRQIETKDYLLPYAAGGRKLIKCGVNFSGESRTIEDWKIEY